MKIDRRPGEKTSIDGARRPLANWSPAHLAIVAIAALLVVALSAPALPAAALTLCASVAFCFLLVDPLISLYLAILSVPVQELVLLPGGVSLTQAAMALAVCHSALGLLVYPERRVRIGRLLSLWLGFLWALVLSAALTPYSQAEALKEILRWAEAFLIWLIAVNSVRRPWQVVGLALCLLAGPLAEALLGLDQFATGAGPPSFRIAPNLPYARAFGTIGQPNSFAGYLNMGWPLALALAVGLSWRAIRVYSEPPRRQDRQATVFRILSSAQRVSKDAAPAVIRPGTHHLLAALAAWVCALILLAGLAVSFSRGAWVGAAAGLLAMSLALGRRARWWALAVLLLAALLLGLGGLGLLPAALADRLASITRYLAVFDAGAVAVTRENFAVVERMSQMQAGARMFLAHPLTGVGPGNYLVAYPAYAVGEWYVSRGHAHNYYLHMAAEAGIVGLVAYLALVVGVAHQAWMTLRHTRDVVWRSAAIGCCGIIGSVLGHDVFENLHVLSMGIQLAAVWGLLTIIEYLEQRPQSQTIA
jgi:O-antigen ligase